MSSPAANGSQDGFTLLETIIAFLILSISLAVAVQTISRGGLAFRRATDIQQASLVMEMLAANQVGGVKQAGETSGKTGQALWKISASEIDDQYPGSLFAIDIEIRPRGEDGPVFGYSTMTALGGGE